MYMFKKKKKKKKLIKNSKKNIQGALLQKECTCVPHVCNVRYTSAAHSVKKKKKQKIIK